MNEEARKLIPSLGKSDSVEMKSVHVAIRNPPTSNLFFSINKNEGGAVSGEVSIGDSDIRFCNEGFIKEHEIALADKMWSFAKDKLGVTGQSEDDDYRDRIRLLESRDPNAKVKKGGKSSSQ